MLSFEEQTHSEENKEAPAKFIAYRDNGQQEDAPNFALLIYDVSNRSLNLKLDFCDQKNKKGFRLVPVENHMRFEKIKSEKQRAAVQQVPKQPAPPKINLQAPTAEK